MRLKIFNFLIHSVGLIFGLKLIVKNHNGENVLTYNSKKYSLIPVPDFKGKIYNSDNLTTTNNHKFINDSNFIRSKNVAESRWPNANKRDISWRLNTVLWAFGHSLQANHVDSINIECGTGLGYMASAIAEYYDLNENPKNFYLIDTFSKELIDPDGSKSESPAEFAYINDSQGFNEVRNYFKKYQSIHLIKGLIPNILEELPNKKISFIHMDLNNANAEIAALEYLKNKFISGTIILFDDYGGYGGDEQAEACDLFATKYKQKLLNIPTGQALIIWNNHAE